MAPRPPVVINMQMPDGTVKPWDMANEPKPDSVGNGSRCGFLYNCYYHPLGKFFQETIKKGITSVLARIHDKEIPRYDKQAYTYDDPRLQNLEVVLKGSFRRHMTDDDCARKQEIVNQAVDIVLFMMKEDVYYRARVFAHLQDLGRDVQAHPELYHLTGPEAFNYYRFPLDLAGLKSVGFPLEQLVEGKIITQQQLDQFNATGTYAVRRGAPA